MYNRDDLYTKLKSISSDDFKLKNLDEISELTSSMLKFIGDTDACLRDNLIYIAFCNFILKYKYYTSPQLLAILNIVLDEDHLFYDIGKTESDSVFTRSFSVLLVALILEYDNKHKILSADDFKSVSKNLLKYLNLEKDFRAYINGKGWAHALAHCADAICEIVLSPYCNKDLVLEIMKFIKAVLLNNSTVFSFEEDERIVIVFMNLLSKNYISEDGLFDYVNSLLLCIRNDENIEDYIMFLNVKNFIRSLYFSLCSKQKYANLAESIFQLERKLNRFETLT